MKGTKMQKGITLIALIITIIVLLVLAMVAIAAIQDSGIILHANRSAIMHEVGVLSEKIRLESQAIKLEMAQEGGNKTQSVQDTLKNLYAKHDGTAFEEVQLTSIEVPEGTESVPESIKEGTYYLVIPEKLNYDISRGKGYTENPIEKNIFVADTNFNVYYLTKIVKVDTPPDDDNQDNLPILVTESDQDAIEMISLIANYSEQMGVTREDLFYTMATGKEDGIATEKDFLDMCEKNNTTPDMMIQEGMEIPMNFDEFIKALNEFDSTKMGDCKTIKDVYTDATKIYFEDKLPSEEVITVDVTNPFAKLKDQTVVAWEDVDSEGIKVLHIAAEGGVYAPTSCYGLFEEMRNIEEIKFNNNFNTSRTKNMSYMFELCTSLKKVDIGTLDTRKVTDMSRLFGSCSSLETIDVSKLNTNNVIDMSGMFHGCSSLKTIDISNLNTENVVNMGSLFRFL